MQAGSSGEFLFHNPFSILLIHPEIMLESMWHYVGLIHYRDIIEYLEESML